MENTVSFHIMCVHPYLFPWVSVKTMGLVKDTGLGLEKVTLHGRQQGSICPLSPAHSLISVTEARHFQIKSKIKVK
jgi:hypothetical protein